MGVPLQPGGLPINIVYHSLTGNARRIAEGVASLTGRRAFSVADAPSGPYLLITHTFQKGQVPLATQQFLQQRAHDMQGVVSTGSYQWGEHFAKAADLIGQAWQVPVVRKINKSGTQADLQAIAQWLQQEVSHD